MPRRIRVPSSDAIFSVARPLAGVERGAAPQPAASRGRRKTPPTPEPTATVTAKPTRAKPLPRTAAPAAPPASHTAPRKRKPSNSAATGGSRRRGGDVSRRATLTLLTRIEAVEAGIRDVPIDCLIDLRDALETLLTDNPAEMDAAAVDELLTRVLPA